jgi:hypothetical protein
MVEMETKIFFPDTSGNEEPVEAYNPRKLFELSDKKAFAKWLPSVVSKVRKVPPEMIYDEYVFESGDRDTFMYMCRLTGIARMLEENGGYTLQAGIFDEFLLSQGIIPEPPRKQALWTKDDGFHQYNGSVRYLEILNTQPDEVKKAWSAFQATGELSRSQTVRLVSTYGPDVHKYPYGLPNRPNTKVSTALSYHEAFVRIPYQFALEVLPDLTDQEAERIFPQTSARDVRDIVLGNCISA